MKYSLQSLMIFVTLVCVLLGGRIEQLRRWAAHHERAAELDRGWNSPQLGDAQGLKFYHEAKASEYRAAMWRPWRIVDEPTP